MATRRAISSLARLPCRTGYLNAASLLKQRHMLPMCHIQQNRNLHTTPRCYGDNQGAKFEIVNIQDMNHFKEQVLKSKGPVIVDFHATWCGPCKHLTPRLEKVLNEHDKPVNLVKVDVDNFQDLAVKYRVQGVPAVFAFKDGISVDSFVGLQEEDIIAKFVSKLTQ